MELLTILTLIGSGYYLNNVNNKKDEKINTNDTDLKLVGNNIYESSDYLKNKKIEFDKAQEVFQKSHDMENTDIVPIYYNTLSMHTYENMIKNDAYDKNLIYSIISSFDAETREAIKNMTGSQNRIRSDWESLYGNNETCIADFHGTILPNRGHESNMTHNNMVPFFGGRIKQNTGENNRLSEGKLEMYTGQFKLNQEQKTEIAPFFAPTRDLSYVSGSQEQRDMTRYIPSNLGKCNNETPFEKVRVGPGLNKGFTAEPSGGHHEMLRILPPSIAELRLDPVIETEGRILSGKNIEKRALHAPIHKNKQTILIENKNGERNFTTVGGTVASELRPEILLRDTSRIVSEEYIGAANKPSSGKLIHAKTKPSIKKNYLNTAHRNAQGKSSVTATYDHGKSTIRNAVTARVESGCKTQTAPAKSMVNSIISFFTDSAKQTKKQTFVPNKYENIIAQTAVPSGAVALSDQMRTTIKETTEDLDHFGISGYAVSKNTAGLTDQMRTTIKETTEDLDRFGISGYAVSKNTAGLTDQMRTTIKETTENLDYLGMAMPETKALTAYLADKAKVTMKQTTQMNNYVGGEHSSKKKAITYDPEDKARITMKQTTLIHNYKNNMNMPTKKAISYDPEDKARTTMKQTTIMNNYVGDQSGTNKHITYDPEDIARHTIKETTMTDKYVRNVNAVQKQAGKGYLTTNWEAKPTNKQELSDNERIGIANSSAKGMQSYVSALNADLNYNKELIAEGRAPTQTSAKIFNSTINMETNKIEEDRNCKYAAMKTSTSGNYFSPTRNITSVKNNLPECDIRLDVNTLSALLKNPLNIDVTK